MADSQADSATPAGSSAGPVLIICAMAEEAAAFDAHLSDASEVAVPFSGVTAKRAQLSLDGETSAGAGTSAGAEKSVGAGASAGAGMSVGAGTSHGAEKSVAAVLVTSNIGLVAAASAATWAITTFAPSTVISAGTGGGLPSTIEVGDIAVAESCTYGTADATEFGYARGQVPRQPVRFPSSPGLVAAAVAAIPGSSTGRLHIGRILSGDTFVTARNVADMREAFPDAVATDMESCAIAQTAGAFGVPFISVRGISDLCGPAAGQDFHISVDDAAARSRAAVIALLAAR